MKEIVSSNSGITSHNEEEKSIQSLKNLPKVFLILILNRKNSCLILLFYFFYVWFFQNLKFQLIKILFRFSSY